MGVSIRNFMLTGNGIKKLCQPFGSLIQVALQLNLAELKEIPAWGKKSYNVQIVPLGAMNWVNFG